MALPMMIELEFEDECFMCGSITDEVCEVCDMCEMCCNCKDDEEGA